MQRQNAMLVWTTALAIAGCATAPYTKRTQLMIVSESQEMQLGISAYREVLG
jgi:hypothetical protein